MPRFDRCVRHSVAPTLAIGLMLWSPLWSAAADVKVLGGEQLVSIPFVIQTDVGDKPKRTAEKFMRPVTETANFFLQVYNLKGTCFDDYTAFYAHDHFDPLIHINIWRSYDDFLADFQRRYKTKSIPGAFFGTIQLTDDYGKPTGTIIREIGTSTEGADDSAVLRDLYHEMGHLFMRTYMLYNVEVPSWIEEGTAQLFQFRIGNGTKPESERDQREGWLREMIDDKSLVPWKDMVNVHNLDNLDLTYQDPLRSTIQYVQSWSMIEFMVASPQRQGAFLDMLAKFKAQTLAHMDDLGREVHDPQEFNRRLQPYLYDIQEATFQKSYGNEFLEVEDIWKKWLQHEYELDLRKKPQLHYYRGDWYLLRARLVKKGEDPKDFIHKASDIFENCVFQEPKSPYGYVGRGRVLLMNGDAKDAKDNFDQALTLSPTNYDALMYDGVALISLGDCAGAVAPLTKAVTAHSTDAQAQQFLGQALAASGGDITETLKHLHSARDLDPKLAPTCCFLEGAAQYVAGHMHEAYQAWVRAEYLQPDLPDIVLFQAMATADQSRDDAAAMLNAVSGTQGGKMLLDILKDPAKPLPALKFSANGWPQIQFGDVQQQQQAGPDTTNDASAPAPAPDATEPLIK